jgi:hypothetical protein
MSLPRETLLELMALADGELAGQEREHAEQLVAQNDEARRTIEGMRAGNARVGVWLGEVLEGRAPSADRIADEVMAKLEDGREDGGLVRLAPGVRRGPRVKAARTTVIAALALAAGVAVYVRSRERGANEGGPVAPVASVAVPSAEVPSAGGARAVAAPAVMASLLGVEVDEIDSPARGISVFEIPLGSAAAAAGGGRSRPSSVVIWIDDEPMGK